MMRMPCLAATFSFVFLGCFLLTGYGCTSFPEAKETKTITELWEPAYQPVFAFEPFVSLDESPDYTVAIVELDLMCSCMPDGQCDISPLEREYHVRFKEAFSEALKRILAAKGISVRGPFPSYDDIGFAERSKCDFVIQPGMVLEIGPVRATVIEELPDYGGPYGEPLVYGLSHDEVFAEARLEYEIIDPRTRRHLDRNVIRSGLVTKNYDQLWSQWTMIYGGNSRTGWHMLEYKRRKYPNYHNADNATGKILEDMYRNFMPRLDGMISAKDFAMLEDQKQGTRNRE